MNIIETTKKTIKILNQLIFFNETKILILKISAT